MTVRVSVRDTKAAIRAAAIRLIAAKGFEHASLREVADEVGITKASLYYHYPSKVDLLAAIVEPVIDEMRAIADDLDGRVFGRAAVSDLLGTYLTALVEHRAEGALFVRDTVAIVNAIGDRFPELQRMDERMRTWLAGPDPDPAAKLRAAAVLQVLGVALTADELGADVADDDVVRVLHEAAMGVLGL